MTTSALQIEFNSLPPELKKEVRHFISFLKTKVKGETKQKKVREFGYAKGKIRLSKDFDEPLEDFKDYM